MNKQDLRIVILTLREPYIADQLMKSGFSVVGVSEVKDRFKGLSKITKIICYVYISLFRRHSSFLSIYAKRHGLGYHEFDKSCIDDYKKWLSNLNPHILILDSAPIVPGDVIEIPKLGTINSHTALLPAYRGPNPTFWQYYDKDMDAGITIHYVNEGIDMGDIIAQTAVPITIGMDGFQLERELATKYAYPLIESFLNKLVNGQVVDVVKQPAESSTRYARKLTNQEYLELLSDQAIGLEKFWHILHANGQWKDVFLGVAKKSNYYEWVLGGYTRQACDAPYYVFNKLAGQYVITHPEGVVRLKKKYNLKMFLKACISL